MKVKELIEKLKTFEMKEYKLIEDFIKWFIKEQNDDFEQEDIMLDSLLRYLNEGKK